MKTSRKNSSNLNPVGLAMLRIIIWTDLIYYSISHPNIIYLYAMQTINQFRQNFNLPLKLINKSGQR